MGFGKKSRFKFTHRIANTLDSDPHNWVTSKLPTHERTLPPLLFGVSAKNTATEKYKIQWYQPDHIGACGHGFDSMKSADGNQMKSEAQQAKEDFERKRLEVYTRAMEIGDACIKAKQRHKGDFDPKTALSHHCQAIYYRNMAHAHVVLPEGKKYKADDHKESAASHFQSALSVYKHFPFVKNVKSNHTFAKKMTKGYGSSF